MSLSFAVALIAPAMANAQCQCLPKPKLDEAFKSSEVVAIARVSEQRVNPLKPDYSETELTVLRSFKGDGEPRVEYLVAYTPKEAKDCGMETAAWI